LARVALNEVTGGVPAPASIGCAINCLPKPPPAPLITATCSSNRRSLDVTT